MQAYIIRLHTYQIRYVYGSVDSTWEGGAMCIVPMLAKTVEFVADTYELFLPDSLHRSTPSITHVMVLLYGIGESSWVAGATGRVGGVLLAIILL